jgi:hypothetical protein
VNALTHREFGRWHLIRFNGDFALNWAAAFRSIFGFPRYGGGIGNADQPVQRMAEMFLFRTAFWLAVVVMLLPTDEKQQARFATFAVATVHQAATFCDRNVRTCEVGADLWATFLRKLDYGTRLAMEVVNERPAHADKPVAQPVSARGPDARPRNHTLAPIDLVPPWRGGHAARSGT